MSRHLVGDYVFARASRADDGDIRRLLRENETAGWIRLSLEREPDAFAAATLMGRHHGYIIARDRDDGALVGMCEWTARPAFIDGEERLLAYLGALRIAPRYRRRRAVLAGGFAAVRELLWHPSATPFALTAIAADNHAALRLLGAGLAGLPIYRSFAAFSTFALRPRRAGAVGIGVEQAHRDDLPAIAVCLERVHRRHQLAPVWRARDLLECCPGLQPQDFLVVRRGPGIAGCVALWDQSAFKQTVVRGYAGPLGRLRPLANLAAPLLRLPNLPAIGEPLRQIYLSHLAVDSDDPALLVALIDAALAEAHRRGHALALTGLASQHPLAAVLAQRYRPREYRALLHVVHWADGQTAAAALTPRLPHVEIAVL